LKTNLSSISNLATYLAPDSDVEMGEGNIPSCKIPNPSPYMQANSYFFGHPKWGREYFETSHCCDIFKARWRAAIGSWDSKVVVDIGCGPGNLYASLGGTPRVLIGVDISLGALEMARQIGYTPLLADAHHLPFIDGFADIVVANATIHHCDNMAQVLAEAARIVRPGGLLVTDLDPQSTAWNFKGLGLLLHQIRFQMYWLVGSKYYISRDERMARFATETHRQKPGDGVTPELYYQTLEPLGFTFKLYPHNHDLGAEVLQGKYGRLPWKNRLGQRLSGINPDTPEAAQSVMCIASRVLPKA